MFKYFILTVAVFGFVSADFAQFREECKTELNIPQESIDKFKTWNFEADESAPCYIECFFKKMGLVSEGQFNVDAIADKLAGKDKTAEDFKPEIQACIDNSIADSCQRIFKGFVCFKQNNLYRIKESVKHD